MLGSAGVVPACNCSVAQPYNYKDDSRQDAVRATAVLPGRCNGAAQKTCWYLGALPQVREKEEKVDDVNFSNITRSL